MSRWKDADEIRREIAYAFGEDLDVLDYLQQQHRAAGWRARKEEAER
ncbi:hypothetical protein [Halorussus halobius]|nr:hypothetical protein [Halorussus halobius]